MSVHPDDVVMTEPYFILALEEFKMLGVVVVTPGAKPSVAREQLTKIAHIGISKKPFVNFIRLRTSALILARDQKTVK